MLTDKLANEPYFFGIGQYDGPNGEHVLEVYINVRKFDAEILGCISKWCNGCACQVQVLHTTGFLPLHASGGLTL